MVLLDKILLNIPAAIAKRRIRTYTTGKLYPTQETFMVSFAEKVDPAEGFETYIGDFTLKM